MVHQLIDVGLVEVDYGRVGLVAAILFLSGLITRRAWKSVRIVCAANLQAVLMD
jgi:hypothetical protein